ncbi:MAG: hypothetical protein R3F56_11160 [Planctomycetota bacterium]
MSRPQRHRRGTIAILALAVAACGPGAIGVGINELRNGKGRTDTVVLVIVNDSDREVVVRFDGTGAAGASLPPAAKTVAPRSRAEIEVSRADAVRVRAAQTEASISGAPVTWDFRLDQPVAGSTVDLATEAVVCAGVRGTATAVDRITLDRIVGDDVSATFATVGGGELPFAPDRSALHPGGGYVYFARDVGPGAVDLYAYRLDACSGSLQPIDAEFGSTPQNPRRIDVGGAFADLDVFVEPLGRMLYVVERHPAETLTVLTLLPILADGSLGTPQATVRGLIGDLAVRPDGRRLYLSEDQGSGFALRDFGLDADGRIDFAAGEAAMPCVATQGGRFALHPNGRFLYAALNDPGSSLVKLGAYFVGDNGGVLQINRSCSAFESVDQVQVDASGGFLYATGTAIGGATRILRHDLDPVSGRLGSLGEQDLGTVSNLAATDDPARADGDPLRRVVHVAVGDRLVPHLRQPDGWLLPVPSGASLDYGSPSTAHFVRGIRRGRAVITTPP